MATFEELFGKQSPESQQRIKNKSKVIQQKLLSAKAKDAKWKMGKDQS